MVGTCYGADAVGYEPASVDLVVYRGDDVAVGIVVKNADGTPVDLTGATAAAQIRKSTEDPDPVAEFTTTIDANMITLGLPHDVSATLPLVALVWDAQLTGADGTTTTVAAGRVRVVGDVTRPVAAAAG